MYRVTISATGIAEAVGPRAAADITLAFVHRPWHKNGACEWSGDRLVLRAENDFDADGLALMDEFSDEVWANVTELSEGAMRVESVVEFVEGSDA